MARWRLMTAHYLNVEGTQWEYSESGHGKRGRKSVVRFDVPMFLNPTDPADCNYMNWRDSGDPAIIVSNEQDNSFPNDIVFMGDPTPDMEPIDDEAKKISESFQAKWNHHPIESLPGQYSASLISEFQRQMSEVAVTRTEHEPFEGFKEVLAMMAQTMKQNQELLNVLTSGAAPQAKRNF